MQTGVHRDKIIIPANQLTISLYSGTTSTASAGRSPGFGLFIELALTLLFLMFFSGKIALAFFKLEIGLNQ
jgi:hypothetical protein